MNWLKSKNIYSTTSPKLKEEAPISIEKRVSPEEWRNVFPDYDNVSDNGGQKVGEPYTDKYGAKMCPNCHVEMIEGDKYRGCIWCGYLEFKDQMKAKEGQSYYNPDKDLNIGDRSEYNADQYFDMPDKPEGQEGAYWPIVTDY